MTHRIRKACILTGGGDAPGLNAVLRAFVKTCEHEGIAVVGSEDGFEGLIQSSRRLVSLTSKEVRGILPKGGSILGCSNTANPFHYGPEGKDVSQDVVTRIKDNDIDVLVLVGGDGTMNMGLQLQKLGIPIIGVPKTIDNDLGATDITFGFETAVSTATWAIDALHSTAAAHVRVMITEVMGRYAGWIALSAGIAGGADVILLPEMPYDIERVARKIRQRSDQGITFSVVVIGEGAHPKGGAAAEVAKGREGHLPRLGGAGRELEEALEGKVNHEIRTTVLGHLQRGGSPCAFDRTLGTRFGVMAAKLCVEGLVGRMVALKSTKVTSVSLEDAVNHPKLVTAECDLVATARAIGIELGA